MENEEKLHRFHDGARKPFEVKFHFYRRFLINYAPRDRERGTSFLAVVLSFEEWNYRVLASLVHGSRYFRDIKSSFEHGSKEFCAVAGTAFG